MRKFLKWTGITVGGLVLLVVVSLGGLYLYASAPLRDTYQIEPAALDIPAADSTVLEKGAHIAAIRECTGCHGGDLSGEVMFDDAIMGTVASSNLTRGEGGIAREYSDADWVRAIRHGVSPEGRALLIMPSSKYAHLGREDLAALIAYLKQLPAVDKQHPELSLGPMLPVVASIAKFPLISANVIDHDAPIPDTPQSGVTAEFGAYLAISCQGCHGDDYTGRNLNGEVSSNLTRLSNYDEATFIAAIRTGVRPSGDSLLMGMPRWSSLSETELQALWTFFDGLEPTGETPSRQTGQ